MKVKVKDEVFHGFRLEFLVGFSRIWSDLLWLFLQSRLQLRQLQKPFPHARNVPRVPSAPWRISLRSKFWSDLVGFTLIGRWADDERQIDASARALARRRRQVASFAASVIGGYGRLHGGSRSGRIRNVKERRPVVSIKRHRQEPPPAPKRIFLVDCIMVF
jgi:hypothetical protein